MLQIENLLLKYHSRELEVDSLRFENGSINYISLDHSSSGDLLLLNLMGGLKESRGVVEYDNKKISYLLRDQKFGFYSISQIDPPFIFVRDYVEYVAELKGVDKNLLSSRLSWFENFFSIYTILKKRLEELSPFELNLVRLFNGVMVKIAPIIIFEPMIYFSGRYLSPFKDLLHSIEESKGCVIIFSYSDPQIETSKTIKIDSSNSIEIVGG